MKKKNLAGFELLNYRFVICPLTHCTTHFGEIIEKITTCTYINTLYFIVYFYKQHVTTYRCPIPLWHWCSTSIDTDEQNLQPCALLQNEVALLWHLGCETSSSTHSSGKNGPAFKGTTNSEDERIQSNSGYISIYISFISPLRTWICLQLHSFGLRSQILTHGDPITLLYTG